MFVGAASGLAFLHSLCRDFGDDRLLAGVVIAVLEVPLHNFNLVVASLKFLFVEVEDFRPQCFVCLAGLL